MRNTQPGDTVKLHYTCRLPDGSVVATSADSEPLVVHVGKQEFIPGVEEAIIGMRPGDKKQAKLEAERAYGSYRQELVLDIESDQFPAGPPAEIGQRLQLSSPDGQVISARVTGVTEERVTVDANHPLAGKDIEYDLELIEIC